MNDDGPLGSCQFDDLCGGRVRGRVSGDGASLARLLVVIQHRGRQRSRGGEDLLDALPETPLEGVSVAYESRLPWEGSRGPVWRLTSRGGGGPGTVGGPRPGGRLPERLHVGDGSFDETVERSRPIAWEQRRHDQSDDRQPDHRFTGADAVHESPLNRAHAAEAAANAGSGEAESYTTASPSGVYTMSW